MLWRVMPLIGCLLFLGVGMVWRTWLQLRRHGHSGVVLFRSGRLAQTVRESLLSVFSALLVGEALAAALAPNALGRLGTIPIFGEPRWRPVGAVLVVAATALMAIAQLDLGASWRIGIEADARPGLVTGGLYRFCRNPIFFCMLVAVFGFVLLLPNWLSLAMFLGAFVGIRQHVFDEEAYLARAYGSDYRVYAGRVGRFLPWVGRLRSS